MSHGCRGLTVFGIVLVPVPKPGRWIVGYNPAVQVAPSLFLLVKLLDFVDSAFAVSFEFTLFSRTSTVVLGPAVSILH